MTKDEAELRRTLDRAGLLFEHDPTWPSVSSLIAGEPVRGSWWGHPAGERIFIALGAVHDDVAFVKLLAGKMTLVHRRLWPAVAAVGRAGEPWQTARLRDDAADVLELVQSEGTIAATDIELAPGCRKLSTIVTDLERRLLLLATQEHSESGKHIRVLHSWARWGQGLSRLTPARGRTQLEAAAAELAPGGVDLLPWRSSA